MGTYADIFGNVTVPQDKLPELTARMLTVAHQGGMMDAIQTERFGKTITLLKPVEIEDGCVDCIFNYFENDFWESAGFNIKEGQMYSNKIGTRDFHAVVLAMYVLQEFYSTTPCTTNVDGRPFDATEYIGWLNYVLGEHYTNERITHPWQLYALRNKHLTSSEILIFAQSDPNTSANYSEMVSCYIIGAFEEDHPDLVDELCGPDIKGTLSPLNGFQALRRIISAIKADASTPDEEKLRALTSMLTLPMKQRLDTPSQLYEKFGFFSVLCPTEVAVWLIADAFSLDFWELLSEMAPTLNYDFLPTLLDPPSPPSPVQPVSSERFLRTTSDERTFWWKEDGDVEFSNEMRCWLRELRAEYSDILSHLDNISDNHAEIFVKTIARAQKECHAYFFAAAFDEFIMRMHHPEVQAAVVLLAQLLDGYTPDGKYYNKDGWIWNTPFSRFNDDFRAYAIKLYYAILANLPLRNKVFGF
ncbi:MAG: hypothetical protein NC081_06735 [Roseburia sp.]|nr:hypothetical protein [Roseburia sp.]